MITRECKRCGFIGNLEEFPEAKTYKHNRIPYCHSCHAIRNAEKQRKYSEKYPERIKAAQEKYNKKPQSKIRFIKYNNSEKGKQYHKKYIKDNYDNFLAKQRKNETARRVKQAGNGVFVISSKDMKRLLSSCCAECGSYDKIHLDHVIPVSRGGRHSIGNLQPLCQRCNLSKNNKLNIEWKHWKTIMKEVI
jgi:5-methylcytosine-specific restriction endonuclease McrA